MAGMGLTTVNRIGDVLVPPSTVVTLTIQPFVPVVASDRTKTFPVMEVGDTLVRLAVMLMPWVSKYVLL